MGASKLDKGQDMACIFHHYMNMYASHHVRAIRGRIRAATAEQSMTEQASARQRERERYIYIYTDSQGKWRSNMRFKSATGNEF